MMKKEGEINTLVKDRYYFGIRTCLLVIHLKVAL